MHRIPSHSSGFTLVELSVVLVIISLLTAGGLAVGASMVQRAAYIDTAKQLDQLDESLKNYYVVNGKLPCPAAINLLPDNANFGVSVANCRTAGAIAGTQSGSGVRSGMIPVRTLGLTDKAGSDQFGSRILYAVTEEMTDSATFGAANGKIDMYGISNTVPIQSGMAYVLYSTGSDRRGGFAYSTGVQTGTCGTTTRDAMNCTYTNLPKFRDVPFNNGDQASLFFDDVIRWAPKYQFMALDTDSTSLWAKRADNDNIYSIGADGNPSNTFVGIGTSNPLIPLHVTGTSAHGINYTRSDARDARISVADTTQQWSLASGWATAGDFSIIQEADGSGPSAGNRFYIQNATGNVGIGTSNPQKPLHVASGSIRVDANDSFFLWMYNSAAPADYQRWALLDNNSTGVLTFKSRYPDWTWKKALISMTHDTGFVGIGRDTPVYQLDVAGSARFSGSSTCYIATGTGNTACTSDKRLKKDILPISDALEKLLAIKGVYYRWNDKSPAKDKTARHLGVLAQDVQKVFPEAVGETTEDGYLTVSLDALVPVLIESIRELKAENDELRQMVTQGSGNIPSYDPLKDPRLWLLMLGIALVAAIATAACMRRR